jgi:hypothetical protein
MGKAPILGTVLLSIMAIGVVIGVILGAMAYFGAKNTNTFFSGDDSKTPTTNNCGDTKAASVSFTMFNKLQTTSAEKFNVTYYVYDNANNLATSGTASDASTITLDCGQTYQLKVVSADGDGGDNAKLLGVRSSSGLKNVDIKDDGKYVSFYTNSPTGNLQLDGSQHGVLEMKMYDNLAAGWTWETTTLSSAVAGAYKLDPAIFSSTTNGTNYTVGTSGKIDVTYTIETNTTDTRFDDFGWYIAVDAATTVWDIPTVRVGGTKLSDVKGTLNVNEARAYSGYEYIYFSKNEIVNDNTKVDFIVKALSGVNPAVADSPQVDFISKGAVKQTTGNDILYSGVGDDTSATTVFAVQDTTIAVV